MDVKIIEQNDRSARIQIKGVSTTTLNSVRRAIMHMVPVLAIEHVTIYKNDSVVFDEFLAHRLGMLAIRTDPKTYRLGDKVKMVLEKEGPGTVYARDIKITDPKIEVIDEGTPVTQLKKGGHLQIEMEAVMGTGSEHVKWQPAVVGYEEVRTGKKNDTDADTFILNIETSGTLDLDEIFDGAFKALGQKNEEMAELVKKHS